jgi:multimeric flavodoxin WrbA
LSGSPRRGGNSDLLCDQFLLGAQGAGHKVEKIRLADLTINYCTGCGACVDNPGKCVQQDDMSAVLEKMTAADVIVMATPVYFYTMNGQMKTLIDRVCPVYTLLRNKDLYFLLAAADEDKEALERTVEGFRGFASCLSGAREKGIVYGTGAWKVGEINGSPAMDQAYRMGKSA